MLKDCLQKGTTITYAYYTNFTFKLHEAIMEKLRGKLPRGILLYHDFRNKYLPCLPDLAHSDFQLSPQKGTLCGKNFLQIMA